MQKTLGLILISLFFGVGFGFLLAVSTGATLEGHDHASHDHSDQGDATGGHAHDTLIDLPSGSDAPSVDMALHSEPGGRNLQILTENFRFSPERVNDAHVDGEGHAHVYIDGIKIARIYGPWFHIGALPENAKTLTVTLNSNDHSNLSVGGVPLSVSCSLPDCSATFATKSD